MDMTLHHITLSVSSYYDTCQLLHTDLPLLFFLSIIIITDLGLIRFNKSKRPTPPSRSAHVAYPIFIDFVKDIVIRN